MKNESKNYGVGKLSKSDVFWTALSILLWGVWIGFLWISAGVWSAIGIFGLGLSLFESGICIGAYKERREAAEKKQKEEEKSPEEEKSK